MSKTEQGEKPNQTKQKFKVSAITQDYNRCYYIIEAFGTEHRLKMFDFQKKEPKPDEIMCLIKTGANGQRVISQDLAPLVANRYKLNNEYEFKVKESHERPGQYDAMTPEGFIFHIDSGKNNLLKDRQIIRGKIRSINGIKVNVEPILNITQDNVPSDETSIAASVIVEMARAIGTTESVLLLTRKAFNCDSAFAEARKYLQNGDNYWLPETLQVACERMPQWLQGSMRHHKLEILDLIRRLCIDLLERSNLATGDGKEQEELREVIANTIRTADTYRMALGHTENNTSRTFAEETIASLTRTGYIYEPEVRLRTLMAIFSLDSKLKDKYMPELINTLTSGDAGNWRRDPLCGALVWMLWEYVRQNRNEADYVMDIELGENKTILTSLIKSLAIILLLTEDKDTAVNRHLCMSSLCRYASLINSHLGQSLNDRAYNFLFGKLPSSMPFSWADLTSNNVGVVCFKLSSCPSSAASKDMVYYEGREAIVSILDRSLTISPHNNATRMHNVLPNWVLPWKDIRVMAAYYENVDNDMRSTEKDTQKFYRMWRGIQDCFFSQNRSAIQQTTPVLPLTTKKEAPMPDEGEAVLIRITHRDKDHRLDDYKNPVFHCVIEDEQFSGEGYITPRDIVHYNVTTADISDFENENGKPLIFEARVESIDSQMQCHFSMRDYVDSHVSSMVHEGEQMLCKMTIKTGNGDSLLISERGFSLKVPAAIGTPDMHQGELAWVEVTDVYEDGKVNAIYLESTTAMEDISRMSDHKCFAFLMRNYAYGVYEPQHEEEYEDDDMDDEQRQAQTEMEREEAQELMSILDRQSLLSSDRVLAYNYLGLAKMIAQAIEDGHKANEYSQRMHLIDMMQQYAINRKLDADEFQRYYMSSEKVLAASRDLHDMATRILCISLLGKQEANEILLDRIKQSTSSLTKEIAELTLAYNIADKHMAKTAAHDISSCINAKLAVTFQDQTDLEYMGEEGSTMEFKTSLVFPSGNGMKADRKKQGTHIVQRVAGMMNDKGGLLMIGVNNQGYAVGLASDMSEFADGRADYDEQSCRDKMDLFFRDMVLKLMPREANDFLSTRFETHKGKTVYVIDIRPSKALITVDGVFYRRYGTTTRVMTADEVRRVRMTR